MCVKGPYLQMHGFVFRDAGIHLRNLMSIWTKEVWCSVLTFVFPFTSEPVSMMQHRKFTWKVSCGLFRTNICHCNAGQTDTEWAGRTADAHVTMMMMKSGNWSRGRGEMCTDKQPERLNRSDLITMVTWPLYGEQTKLTQMCVRGRSPSVSFCIRMRDQYRQEETCTHRGWNTSVVHTAQYTFGRTVSIYIRVTISKGIKAHFTSRKVTLLINYKVLIIVFLWYDNWRSEHRYNNNTKKQ